MVQVKAQGEAFEVETVGSRMKAQSHTNAIFRDFSVGRESHNLFIALCTRVNVEPHGVPWLKLEWHVEYQ